MAEFTKQVEQLIEMGFDEEQSKAALEKCSGNVEQAMEHLMNSDLEEGSTGETSKTAKSIRCVDTGKLFRNMNAAMIYAERTGHANFEECDEEIPPMTAEEKKKKVEELRERIKQKRAEREEKEKKDAITLEKKRRAGGQEMAAIREAHEKAKREREYELMKKEKEASKREKERLRKEIAMDKAERAADKARKQGKDAKAAFDEAFEKALKGKSGESDAKKSKRSGDDVQDAIKTLKEYRAGGDGDRALGILKKLVGNPLNKPDEPKFRSVNLANDTIRKKLASLRGGVALLKAVGFKKNVKENKLELADEDYDEEKLSNALSQIEQALA